MPSPFPNGLTSFGANPVSGSFRNNPSLATHVATAIDAIKASERALTGAAGTDDLLAGAASLAARIATIAAAGIPTASIVPTLRATAASGFLFMYGQQVSQTTYADLYAQLGSVGGTAAAGMFVIPDARGRTLTGLDNMGDTAGIGPAAGTLAAATTRGARAGTATKTIAIANLPAHVHDHTHTHTGDTNSVALPHSHTLNRPTSTSGSHNHVATDNNNFTVFVDPGSGGSRVKAGEAGDASFWIKAQSMATAGDHTHTVTGSTASDSPSHSHTLVISSFVGNTSSVGAGTALDVTSPYLAVNMMIKT